MTESNRIEYKTKLTDGLEKEIVAFLNYKEGGIVYIGIDKFGKSIGLEDCDELQLKIKDRLKNNIVPSCMGLFDIVLEQKENKDIIKIIIASGSETPYYVKKYGMSPRGCFIRLGSASEPMSITMIEELFSKRTRNSLGRIKSHRQDLTFAQLKIYYEARGLKLNKQFSSNLELLTENGDYNYVAYLMADSNGTSIKVAKYNGLNKVHLIENNEYGYCSLVKATKSVLDKLELENRTATLITSKERINQRLWNPLALKEAVINAIVHNDYTHELPPVFEIYDDRLEITSSGGLSVIKNKEKFFKGYSNPINREIMRIYKDLDMVEQLGSGMNRILSFYKKDIFIFDDDFLKMVFISNYDEIDGGSMSGSMGGSISGSIELTSRQQEIIKIIKANNKIGYRTLAEKLNINDSAVKKHLNNLKDKGILKRVGGTRGYWEVLNG